MIKKLLGWSLSGLIVAAPSVLAEIRITLSATSIAQNEPVRVTYEVRGNASTQPDLSPLRQDFDIVNRSASRSVRTFNGQTDQRTQLSLTLLPRRSGELTLPAIDFGTERSEARKLTVTPAAIAAGGGQPAPTNPGLDPGAEFPFAPPGGIFSQPFGAPPDQSWFAPPPGPEWGGLGNTMPDWTPEPEVEETAAAPQSPEIPPRQGPDYWAWIALIALLGWLVTTITLWRTRANPPQPSAPAAAIKAEQAPTPVPAPTPPDPAELAAEVREAYKSLDPFAAKEALLRWAACAWPVDPPNNLSRLAARCPPLLQRHVLKLEEAIYSPSEVRWSEFPIWEHLEGCTTGTPPGHEGSA